jgi:uncharacterized protein (TIGR03790 family)
MRFAVARKPRHPGAWWYPGIVRPYAQAGLSLLATACLPWLGCGGSHGQTAGPAGDASPGDATVVDAGVGDAVADAPRDTAPPAPVVLPVGNALAASAVAVIVNADDPNSVAIGSYYQQKRNLPAANVVSVHIPTGATITSAQFAPVQTAVAAATPAGIQAYALAFTQPYEVECMSITSAFAFGFDTKWCNTTGGACGATAQSPYYDTDDPAPYTDLQMRPTMMLAGTSVSEVEALIDRGVAADDTHPDGTAYMVITSDAVRSVRAFEFQELAASWDPATGIKCVIQDNSDGGSSDALVGKTDVLFYFTGLADVPDIDADTYLPGAFADHLTSFGGQVPTSSQMSAVAWLQVGATASYGTVTEPCNYTEKFPDPSLAVPRYFQGATALEAYWKSVQWPGEGLFIGEPLSAPWRSPIVTFDNGTLTIKTSALDPGVSYRLEGADVQAGPFAVVKSGISTAKYDYVTITVPDATYAYYRIVVDVDGGED